MEPVPGPWGLPVIGNLLDVQSEEGLVKAMENLADIYGPFYQLTLGGQKYYVASSAELLKQLCDETRWIKAPPPALANSPGPKGLFLARGDDPDWGQAHRILAPAFGPLAIGDVFDGMRDIAHQLILKWARQEEGHQILLTDDATRLTLDTIALCTMDYRFNSFYSEKMHPFVESMLGFLSLSQKLSVQPTLVTKFLGSADQARLHEYGEVMNKVAQDIVARRRSNPNGKQDMLNTLLYGKDPKTGAVMRDELIAAEMITFLIAGHETTSGLIRTKTYLKAQQEVDQVLGNGPLTLESLKKLKYVNAVFRETLRLTPTAPNVTKLIPPNREKEVVTVCDGKYRVEYGTPVRVMLARSMRDPTYFGEDANEFNPDRMTEDNPNFEHCMKAWKPFGNGTRSCIGQALAWQEALMITSLILHNFDMGFVDGGYKTRIKQTLTIKPDHMYVKVRPRKGLDAQKIERRLSTGFSQTPVPESGTTSAPTSNADLKAGPVILYGGNSGTCYSLAQKTASNFAIKLAASATVQVLDSVVENMSTERPLVIITSSYEGQPPDNAARFVTWLESSKSKDLTGVKFAVFGCGNRDWRETYQRVPKLVDRLLEERGATRIFKMGSSDVSQGTVLDDYGRWLEELTTTLNADAGDSGVPPAPSPDDLAQISTNLRARRLSNGLAPARVKEVKTLTEPGTPEKKHMEIELPDGMNYEAGDYLSVLPMNPEDLVRRMMNHWKLPGDAAITLKTTAFGALPTNVPLGIHGLLKGFFELSQPVSKANIAELKQFTEDADTVRQLDALVENGERSSNMGTPEHTTIFDLLSRYPSINMPFQFFLSSLLPLHIRQYSISSSPLASPSTCTITYTVVHHDAQSGADTNGPTFAHEGVASTYLAGLLPGDTLHVSIKRTATATLPCPFRLPPPGLQASTPLIMYCAGSGLAPFRGFIQQRATILESNPSAELAPALLFIGCRSPIADRLYADELERRESLGAVSLRYAFSKAPTHPLAAGCAHLGDRIVHDQAEIRDLWARGARVYMCGSRNVQRSVRASTEQIFELIAREKGWNAEQMEAERVKFQAALTVRAVSDVFD